MNIRDILSDLFERRPKVTICLMVPPEVIDKGWSNVSMTTDGLEFFGCYGILRNEYIFKGKLKVDIDK